LLLTLSAPFAQLEFTMSALFKPMAAVWLAVALTACATPSTAPTAPAAAAGCMQLQVARLKVGQGLLLSAAYGSADTFFKKPVWIQQSEAKSDTVTVDVCGVTSDEVAFSVFQDLNGNGKLDMNPMGIPTEPYGMSGKPVFGAPSWGNAKVPAGAGRLVRIEL
jgi:uncharacterized protein (DUF2141 family)